MKAEERKEAPLPRKTAPARIIKALRRFGV